MAKDRDNIPSPCPFCDKVYEWKRGLRRHLSKYHLEKTSPYMVRKIVNYPLPVEKILQQTNTPKTQHGAQS